MRISDWSSDVCSSDLLLVVPADQRLGAVQCAVGGGHHRLIIKPELASFERAAHFLLHHAPFLGPRVAAADLGGDDIAALVLRFVAFRRASCRDRFCQSVYISLVAVSLQKKT